MILSTLVEVRSALKWKLAVTNEEIEGARKYFDERGYDAFSGGDVQLKRGRTDDGKLKADLAVEWNEELEEKKRFLMRRYMESRRIESAIKDLEEHNFA